MAKNLEAAADVVELIELCERACDVLRIPDQYRQDTIQDTILSVWNARFGQAPLKFELSEPVAYAYILKAVKSRFQHLLRNPQDERLDDLPADSHGLAGDELEAIDAEDGITLLWRLISDMDRELLTLSYLEGWSTGEIAIRLKIDETAVRQRLSRARKRLRRGLQERGIELDDLL